MFHSACDLRMGWQFTFQHDNDLRLTANTILEWLHDNQSPELNPMKDLWEDPKMTADRFFLSNLLELERICQEEWDKPPKPRCEKLVEIYPGRPKGASTQHGIKVVKW